jgi:hypothetical protein
MRELAPVIALHPVAAAHAAASPAAIAMVQRSIWTAYPVVAHLDQPVLRHISERAAGDANGLAAVVLDSAGAGRGEREIP